MHPSSVTGAGYGLAMDTRDTTNGAAGGDGPDALETLRARALALIQETFTVLEETSAAPLTVRDLQVPPLDPGADQPALHALRAMSREGEVSEHVLRAVRADDGTLLCEENPAAWFDRVVRDHAHGLLHHGGLPSAWAGHDPEAMLRRAEAGVVAYTEDTMLLDSARDRETLQRWLDAQLAESPAGARVLSIGPGQIARIDGSMLLEYHVGTAEGELPVQFCPARLDGPTGAEWYRALGNPMPALGARVDGEQLMDFEADYCLPLDRIPPRAADDPDPEEDPWFALTLVHPDLPVAILMPTAGTALTVRTDGDGSLISVRAHSAEMWELENSVNERFDAIWGRWLQETPQADPAEVRWVREQAEEELRDLLAAEDEDEEQR